MHTSLMSSSNSANLNKLHPDVKACKSLAEQNRTKPEQEAVTATI